MEAMHESPAGLVLACLFLAVLSLVGIAVPELLWGLSSWRYRNAEAMEPTKAQYRVHRARYAALLSLSVPPLIGLAWPGDGDLKVRVWMISAVASVVIIIAVLVLVSIVRRRSREATIDHNRPSELSSAGYGAEWFGVIYTFFYVLLIVGIFASIQASAAASRQEALDRNDGTLSPAEQRYIDELIEELDSSRYTPAPPEYVDASGLPVYTAVPEGLFVGGTVRMQTNDAGEMRLLAPLNACPLAGVIVIESSVNVSVGFAYDASAAGGADPATFCVKQPGTTLNAVPLPTVLGDRVLLTLDGVKVPSGRF